MFIYLMKVILLLSRFHRYQFLFEELVKRDFKTKYKRTILGMAWSMLSPLLTLLVMYFVFSRFFGRSVRHYVTYLFCGNLVFSFFSDATNQGMYALVSNAHIFTKVNVPKYLFLLSKSVQTLINFGLTLVIFFLFCALDGVPFTWKFLLLVYPIVCLMVFNIGVGFILSALFVFFKDIQYLWSIFIQLLMYMSAIFYTIDHFPERVQFLFNLNPVFVYIRFFRRLVIDSVVPSPQSFALAGFYAVAALLFGGWMYRHYNQRFLYYV